MMNNNWNWFGGKWRERETFGPIGDNPLLKHIDGGGGWIPKGSDVGAIVQPKLDVNQILFRHLNWLVLYVFSTLTLTLTLPSSIPKIPMKIDSIWFRYHTKSNLQRSVIELSTAMKEKLSTTFTVWSEWKPFRLLTLFATFAVQSPFSSAASVGEHWTNSTTIRQKLNNKIK